MPRKRPQVLGVDLNRSESRRCRHTIRQEAAALRDFNLADVHFGSKAAEMIGTVQRPMSALSPKADNAQTVSLSLLCPKAGIRTATKKQSAYERSAQRPERRLGDSEHDEERDRRRRDEIENGAELPLYLRRIEICVPLQV